jgi:hydrogenase nickel incorporation protein HypA/HybF
MHEQSLAKSLVQQVLQIAQAHAASRVKEVKMVVGEFSGVEPELLASAFRRETSCGLADGAALTLRCSPLVACCSDCSIDFPVRNFTLICSSCNGRNVTIVRGEELLLESVILET